MSRIRCAAQRLCLVMLLLAPLTLLADDSEGGVTVESANLELDDGVYYLDAHVDYRLSDEAREALARGMPLIFELQLELTEQRDWLPDSGIAQLSQRYQIRYHALSDRYVLINLNSGVSRSFATEDGVLSALGEVEQLPVIDRRLLVEDHVYQLALRARLDPGGLPLPIRTMALVMSEWQLTSEWYIWLFEV